MVQVAAVVGAPAPLAYAFTLGLVAAINPCGFPLLPAYLTISAGQSGGTGAARRTARALAAGASATVGFVIVFGILGLLVESGVRLAMAWVPWVMIPLAAAMLVVGALTMVGRSVRPPVPAWKATSRHGVGMVAFGVAYAVGSLTCALPVFLAGVAGSFTRSGFVLGSSTFVAYALGMGLLLTVVSLIVAHAGAPGLRRVRPFTRVVPRVGGAVLTLVGAYLLLYWISDLVAPTSTTAPVQTVESLQSALSGWLAGSSRLIGVVLGVVVVTALALLAVSQYRRRPAGTREEGQEPDEDAVAAPREEEPVGA